MYWIGFFGPEPVIIPLVHFFDETEILTDLIAISFIGIPVLFLINPANPER